MKTSSKPWKVEENCSHVCPVSGEKYGPGEGVLEGVYFELVPRTTDLYELREDLGVFSVPSRMLRAGGPTEPIQFLEESRSRRSNSRKFYRLPHTTAARIIDLIENVYKDKDSSR